jgi:hypothetical protein
MKKKYQVSAIVQSIAGRSHYVPRRWQVAEQETPFQIAAETRYNTEFFTAAALCLSFYTSTVSIDVSGLCKLSLKEALLLKQHQGWQQHQVTAIINALQKTAIR